MNYLKPVVVAVEVTVAVTCATAAYGTRRQSTGLRTIATIAAMECLRVPLAMSLPGLKFAGISLCVLTLAASTPLTFEGMSLAFEQFMHQRVIAVAKAQHNSTRQTLKSTALSPTRLGAKRR